jgi:ATPase subunit of ABC transporter with duplicated ATPase domains
MLSASNVSLRFGKRVLFEDVNVKFTKGNCYGVIGANGAGKSTFMKILAGEIESTTGRIEISPGERMSVLKQNRFEFEESTVLETVLMGFKELYEVKRGMDEIYAKPDFSDADGMKVADLQNKFDEMGGWTAESDAAELISNLGVTEVNHHRLMKEVDSNVKVRVLLAQALFGNPDVLIMDEPTNDLDTETIMWLENFLADYENTVIVVSHDRHFLDAVCTHITDLDRQKMNVYSGNYTFWYESSQLASKQLADKSKKAEQRKAELMDFIARFSANASKAKQATSRKKALDKLDLDKIQPSSRRYPGIVFKMQREVGDQILRVDSLTASVDGEMLFKDVSFTVEHGHKITLISKNSLATTTLYQILAGKAEADKGTVNWGVTVTPSYIPNDNSEYFDDIDLSLVDWLRQFSKEKDETFIRGFLGRMLFSGEESLKSAKVLSGGEKVRCLLSKIMLEEGNFLLLDEPTSHLDLEAITTYNTSLINFPSNLIFTSQDHQFTQTVANRVIEITPKGMIDKLMPYDDYLLDPEVIVLRAELYS